jgi:hypothetical protein
MTHCGLEEKVKKLVRKRLNSGRRSSSYKKQVRVKREEGYFG